MGNYYYVMLLLIFFCPQHPAVNAHDGVVEVHACFAIEVAIYADENVNDGIDEANRVYQYVLNSTEPNACNTGKYSNVFPYRGMPHALYELAENILHLANL